MTAAHTRSESSRFNLEGLRAMGLNFDTLPRRLSTTNATRLQRIERLTNTLDTAYRVPGTNVRVGLDSIIGLLPVVGDSATALMSFYILYEARKMGVSRFAMTKMLANIGLDVAVGAVPLVGDLFDLAFKANVRNLKVIQAELERMEPAKGTVDATSFQEKNS